MVFAAAAARNQWEQQQRLDKKNRKHRTTSGTPREFTQKSKKPPKPFKEMTGQEYLDWQAQQEANMDAEDERTLR